MIIVFQERICLQMNTNIILHKNKNKMNTNNLGINFSKREKKRISSEEKILP